MPNNADLAAARAASTGKRKKGRGRRISKAQKAAEEAAAEETAEEAEEAKAAEARRASARHARQAQLAGSVAEVKPSRADKVACAEAELVLTVEQVALRKMRAQGHGWVCALWPPPALDVLPFVSWSVRWLPHSAPSRNGFNFSSGLWRKLACRRPATGRLQSCFG